MNGNNSLEELGAWQGKMDVSALVNRLGSQIIKGNLELAEWWFNPETKRIELYDHCAHCEGQGIDSCFCSWFPRDDYEAELQSIEFELQEWHDQHGITKLNKDGSPHLPPNVKLDEYGHPYEAAVGLREKFPRSYFLWDVMDVAISEVDCMTGAVVYDWESVGYLWILYVENNRADYDDRVYGATKVVYYVENIPDIELQGRVRPIIAMPRGDVMKKWEDRDRYR